MRQLAVLLKVSHATLLPDCVNMHCLVSICCTIEHKHRVTFKAVQGGIHALCIKPHVRNDTGLVQVPLRLISLSQ